jgi:hypothetical protein
MRSTCPLIDIALKHVQIARDLFFNCSWDISRSLALRGASHRSIPLLDTKELAFARTYSDELASLVQLNSDIIYAHRKFALTGKPAQRPQLSRAFSLEGVNQY